MLNVYFLVLNLKIFMTQLVKLEILILTFPILDLFFLYSK